MIRRNILFYNIYSFLSGLWLFAALSVVYFEQITNSYALAMLAFSFVNLAQSLMEVPCGMISDRLGRRKTLIASAIMMFINMLFWASAGYFDAVWMLFVGSMLRGISLALRSGTDTAFIYETLVDLHKKSIFDQIYAKGGVYNQLGLVTSAIVATIVVYYSSLQILAWLSVIPVFLLIIVTFLFIEPKSNFESGISPLQQLKKSLHLFATRKKLRTYSILQIMSSSVILSVYRFESLYYQQLVPLYLINISRMLQHALGCLSFWIVSLVRKYNFLNLLFFSLMGSSLIRLLGILLNNILTPFVTAAHNLFYGVGQTAQTTLLQKEYHKSLRATMSSLVELLSGFGVAIAGYFLGLVADYRGTRISITLAVILQIIIALMYRKMFYTSKKTSIT